MATNDCGQPQPAGTISDVPIDFAKIKALRIARGLTQERAAVLAGFGTRQRWNDIESGRKSGVTVTTLDRIAKALGTTVKDLVT